MAKKIKKYFENKFLIFASLFIFTLVIYFDSLKHFFYQDDLWHFYISNAHSFKDFLDFFNPINKFAYQTYRPLSTQVLFFTFDRLFGMNHFIFQILALSLLSLNASLLYTILRKYTKNIFALLLSLFYILHHQNIGIVYYLSTIQLSLALLFTLLAVREIQEKHGHWQIKIFGFYILAILSQEISLLNSLIFPIMLAIEDIHHLQKNKKLIISLLLTTVFYLLFRFYFVNQQIFTNTHYQISLQPKTIINNLLWYCLWMMSVPEYVINFVGSGFKPLPPLFGQYRWESIGSLLILALNASTFAFFFFHSLRNKKHLLYLICFVLALAPILIFPWHKYVYYLPIASVFLLIFFGKVIGQEGNKKYYFLLIAIMVTALASNLIDRRTSYNYKRGSTAQKFRENVNWETLRNGKKIIFVANDPTFAVFSKDWGSTSSQAKIVLKENFFFTLLSKNNDLQVIYEDDLKDGKIPSHDYQIVAKKEW